MGKASAQSFKPHEVEAMARQQNRMNNPNQTNIFGSTTTTFGGDDQASIVQELSEPMQNIINSQMDFVGQGPAQLGQYNNPFIEGIMNNTMNSLARTGGWGSTPNASMMGGFQGSAPQFNQMQQEAAQALGADPNQQINLSQAPALNFGSRDQGLSNTEKIRNGVSAGMNAIADLNMQPVNTGRVNQMGNDANQLGQGLMAFLQKQKGG